MKDDSLHKGTRASGAYEARPWLKQYPDYIQPEIQPQFANGLEIILESVKTMPEQAALYYFDQAISYRELDRASTALAAAF